jgi:hypothetical protein
MKLAAILALTAVLALPAKADELVVARFSAGDLTGWTDKKFKGKTVYSLVSENGQTVLQAHSKNAASGLLKKISLKASEYPFLRWSWKVEHSLKREDISCKAGDDFAARVYVVFPRGFFVWQNRAINYVWASKMALCSSAPSPYTSNSVIIAVESGDNKAGTWVTEERNIFEDYRKAFGGEPPPVGAVAIMSDTDDTGDEVTAWYGDITFSRGKKTASPLH